MSGEVTRPAYYRGPFECILLVEQCSFNIGNMCKYVWRHRDKGHPKEDLEKALWYADRAKSHWEEFHGGSWRADSPVTEFIRSPYDFSTLCLLKAYTVEGAENDFWKAMAEADAAKAIDALKTLIREADE